MKVKELFCLAIWLAMTGCVSAKSGRNGGLCDVSMNYSEGKFISQGEDLQSLYLKIIPEEMKVIVNSSLNKTEVYLDGKMTLPAEEQVRIAGDYFYGQQVRGVVEYCRRRGQGGYTEHDAAVLVESVYAAVVSVAGLREASPEVVESQLPSIISPNLTARVGFIGISAFCSVDVTPRLDVVLSKAAMQCRGGLR